MNLKSDRRALSYEERPRMQTYNFLCNLKTLYAVHLAGRVNLLLAIISESNVSLWLAHDPQKSVWLAFDML